MYLFRQILVAAIALAPAATLAAQSPLVGARIGIGEAGFSGSDWETRSAATGAVFVRFPLHHPRASLQVEAAWVRRGASRVGDPPVLGGQLSSARVSLGYLQIPITLHLRLDQKLDWPVHPTVFLGPALALRVSCGYQSDLVVAPNPEADCRSPYEGQLARPDVLIPFTQTAPFDVGGVVGASLAVPLTAGTQGLFDLRYERGLVAVDPGAPGFRNAAWSLSLGFMRRLGR
jgi:hypothetical protein